MNKILVTFIDLIGLKYHGDTLKERGLGGSESAVICMAKELTSLGIATRIFNNCEQEGFYDGVEYLDLSRLDVPNTYTTDVFIVSRSGEPFIQDKFNQLKKSAKLKVLWMHDTFCGSDPIIEDLVVRGEIDEIFTLSDFHTAYISNCWHGGNRRNFEVLKNKIWITRNGINLHIDEVDIASKDPDLFVYNASVSKGMKPLLNSIWPVIKQAIPNARLKIIGGYYNWNPEKEDVYEKDVKDLWQAHHGKNGVEFTGIIPQHKIAEILAKASLFIYPAAFPETFGISTLESLAYNTPLITNRFGALEETAIENACYLIDYAIEPNNLFPAIDSKTQIGKFINLVLQTHSNKYLLQQKQNYCSIVKDICTWDTVAVQWKQHFFGKLGLYLPVEETRKANRINQRVQEVFGRRFSNKEDYLPIESRKEWCIDVIVPCYNASAYIEKCIDSVATQDYDNWHCMIINDASTDDTYEKIRLAIDKYPSNIGENFTVLNRKKNCGAVANQYDALNNVGHGITILLDGDDWLMNNPYIFSKYNRMYQEEGLEFTYGSCWSLVDNIPLIAQDYPKEVKKNKAYRSHHFNWILPYTHLRTFASKLAKNVFAKKEKLLDADGNFYRAGGDGAMFYALIEEADPTKVKAVKDIVYVYNDASPLNDYKVNGEEQTRNARRIAGLPEKPVEKKKEIMNLLPVAKKKILIGIPTAKYIEPETFKAIYDLEVPEEYETTFQFFYGYNIDQVRNLIAHWIVDGKFDYLFSVDSDISFPSDTLKKLLAHDKDIVTGVYRQRKDNVVLELYGPNGNINLSELQQHQHDKLYPVDGCGFGCVLVKRQVFVDIGYPQFQYHSAIDHQHTISEDVDFCRKAKARGYFAYADLTIKCKHHGSTTYEIPAYTIDVPQNTTPEVDEQTFLRDLRTEISIPMQHKDFLLRQKVTGIMMPRVVYDIGACVLHWTDYAKELWPTADFYAFEAMSACKFLYDEEKIPSFVGVLGQGQEVDFYENIRAPGGNSYYRENPAFSDKADEYYPIGTAKKVVTKRLDDIVKENNFPQPDLIKIDVQGAELDILKGAQEILKNTKWLILELPKVEYNIGAPTAHETIEWLAAQGFRCAAERFSDNGADADYLFYNIRPSLD
jgi:FkbM family methyltransferase